MLDSQACIAWSFGDKVGHVHHIASSNPILKDMLWHYVNPVHDDWDKFLALVEFAYNDLWK
jgi:hypothetical protein